MKRKQHNTLARSAMKLLCIFLGLVLVVMLAATCLFQQLLNMVQYTDTALTADRSLLSVFSRFDLSQLSSGNENPKIGGWNSGITNILLIGQDRREGESFARSDSMILCTYHKESGKITMTSFLRDLYVEIPGYGSNRINAAYSNGGMELLKETLEHNFDLHIDGCVEVDFSQFSQIIDLLGGVELTLRQDEAECINLETGSTLTEGTHILTGEQALAFSRIRNLDVDGDISRTSRQRKVISALVESYRDIRMSQVVSLIQQLLPMITTDMNHGQLLMLAAELLPNLADAQIVSQRIPADGAFTDQIIHGMAVLSADMDAARDFLRKTLLNP